MNRRNQTKTVAAQAKTGQNKHRSVFPSIFVAVVCGGLTITGLGHAEAATVANPSFEADTFTVFPRLRCEQRPGDGLGGGGRPGTQPCRRVTFR